MHVEVQPKGPKPIEPEQVETRVSNVNADNVETEEIGSNDPNVALHEVTLLLILGCELQLGTCIQTLGMLPEEHIF
jgi:hypothetical protein